MLGAVRYAIANLVNYGGRDARPTFWYYVLFVMILRFIAGITYSLPLIRRSIHVARQAVLQGDSPAMVKAQTLTIAMDMLPTLVWFGVAVGILTMALLAASLVRRLHDSGLSGFWMLAPGLLYAGALANAPSQASRVMGVLAFHHGAASPGPMSVLESQGALAILPWIAVILVVIFGVRPSDPGSNRYGDAPVRF